MPCPDAARRGCYRRPVPAPRRYVTDGIVLSRFDLGEADRVLTMITPELGKIRIIAKGVRRPTSRLGGSLEPFAELNVGLARGRTFDVVTEVRVGHAWLKLRDSLESAATAWYIAELADRSLEERHEAEPLYALLRRAYELLDAGMAPGRVARWYEMHLADELGQRPEVDRCVECDRMLEATGSFRWVPPLGGVLCDRCPGPPAERAGLSLDALKLLKAYQRLDIEAIAALRLTEATEREVEGAMRDFIRVSLERDARSLAFLDEVRSRPAARLGPAASTPASATPASATPGGITPAGTTSAGTTPA
jgi:DNA repair protein RecO (recombination protein O)